MSEEAPKALAPGEVAPPRPLSKGEQKTWDIFNREARLMEEYRQINPIDFTLGEMLITAEELRRGMQLCREEAEKEQDPKQKLSFLTMHARIASQHGDTVNRIHKYQELKTHSQFKERKKNRGAKPGQQVRLTAMPKSAEG